MKHGKQTAALALCGLLLVGALCACNTAADVASTVVGLEVSPTVTAESAAANDALIQSILRSSVSAPDTTNATRIVFSGEAATVTGSGVTAENGVATITSGGVYVISGETTNGRVIVNAPKEEVSLVLQNAQITCSYGSALYSYRAAQTLVYLPDGTQSTLTDGSGYTFDDGISSATDDEPNACLYSKTDLVLAGGGTLMVNANYNNGITSKDTLKIDGSTVVVTAKNHGINGKDSLILKDADVTVNSGGDALSSTNTADAALGYLAVVNSKVNLTAAEDGIQAETNLTLYGVDGTVTTAGGSNGQLTEDTSAKGLKAGKNLILYSGEYVLNCADDAIHSNGNVTVYSGSYTIATGDDGIHADEAVTVSGGEIQIDQCYEGIEGATVTISDGKIHIVSSDDGINAAGGADQSGFGGVRADTFGGNSAYSITITGGEIDILASGDGIDSNGDLTITDGTVVVYSTSVADDQPLDTDGTISITGGTVFVAGGSAGMGMNLSAEQPYVTFGSTGMGGIGMGQGRAGMAENPGGQQGGFATQPTEPNGQRPEGEPPANAGAPGMNGGQDMNGGQQPNGTALIAAGSTITIKDSDGNTVYSGTAPCQINYALLCSAQVNTGTSYTLYANDAEVSTATASTGTSTTQQF